tara:strand:- start:1958 stop:2125 length:168 start_codon:yes stop_codon:yes gene_type:complete
MADYKGIQGFTIQSLASDPTPSADNEGQLYFNTASGVYKIIVDDGGYTAKTLTTS